MDSIRIQNCNNLRTFKSRDFISDNKINKYFKIECSSLYLKVISKFCITLTPETFISEFLLKNGQNLSHPRNLTTNHTNTNYYPPQTCISDSRRCILAKIVICYFSFSMSYEKKISQFWTN